jgi:hypothetical protein
MNVAATGTWSPRANARSSGAARRRMTPLPASVHHHRGQVLRQLHVGRARLRQLRDAERLAHDLRDRGRLADSLVPLGDGLQHSHDVDELVGFLVGLVGAGLARQRDHRCPIQVGVGDPGDEVRRARTQG